jgi:hypothetical protein
MPKLIQSPEIRTVKGKRKLIREFMRRVEKDLLDKVPLMPAEWDGFELRWLIADAFEWEQRGRTGAGGMRRRVREYENEKLVRNLEAEKARELVKRCEHLEALGIPVSAGSAVWNWEWFAGLTPETFAALPPLVHELILQHRDLYEDANGRFCWLQSKQPDPADFPYTVIGEFGVFDCNAQPPAQQRSLMAVVSDNLGNFYHPLRAAGWNIAQMGQEKDNGCCYATTEQLLNWFRSKGAM